MDIAPLLREECPSKLTSTLKEIERNPSRASTIKKDAKRFVRRYGKWVQPPCPPALVSIMQYIGLSKGPIGIIASYMYEPLEIQVKDIFDQIASDDTAVMPPIISRFNQLVNNATCFTPERIIETDPMDKLLSLCMFTNERIHIAVDEKKIRGTILCLGLFSLRPYEKGDCCSWASVAGIHSDIVKGESSIDLYACSNAMGFLIEMTDQMPEDVKEAIATGKAIYNDENNDSAFDRFLNIALLSELANPRPYIINQIMWIMDNFKNMNEIQDRINELEDVCKEEKRLYLNSLRRFIRHKIMEAVYESDRYPLFPMLNCELCDREAFTVCSCGTVRYCSRECQSANWGRHQKTCKRLSL